MFYVPSWLLAVLSLLLAIYLTNDGAVMYCCARPRYGHHLLATPLLRQHYQPQALLYQQMPAPLRNTKLYLAYLYIYYVFVVVFSPSFLFTGEQLAAIRFAYLLLIFSSRSKAQEYKYF